MKSWLKFFSSEKSGGLSIKETFLELAARLEIHNSTAAAGAGSEVIEIAKDMRDLLIHNQLELNRTEKVRVIKAINKAKVRALLSGNDEGCRTFSSLDSISADVMRVL